MIAWLRDLLGIAPPPPATRLDEAVVFEIARAALAKLDPPFDPVLPLLIAKIEDTPDGPVWLVTTATRGSGADLRIADADGRVLNITRRHSR